METEQGKEEQFRVVRNNEEQYSIWPLHRDLPAGWVDAGKSGPKSDCLSWIQEVWTDMRPLSLRQQQDACKS
jgi:MbtH protein